MFLRTFTEKDNKMRACMSFSKFGPYIHTSWKMLLSFCHPVLKNKYSNPIVLMAIEMVNGPRTIQNTWPLISISNRTRDINLVYIWRNTSHATVVFLKHTFHSDNVTGKESFNKSVILLKWKKWYKRKKFIYLIITILKYA